MCLYGACVVRGGGGSCGVPGRFTPDAAWGLGRVHTGWVGTSGGGRTGAACAAVCAVGRAGSHWVQHDTSHVCAGCRAGSHQVWHGALRLTLGSVTLDATELRRVLGAGHVGGNGQFHTGCARCCVARFTLCAVRVARVFFGYGMICVRSLWNRKCT